MDGRGEDYRNRRTSLYNTLHVNMISKLQKEVSVNHQYKWWTPE